jgi:hypothetical protein
VCVDAASQAAQQRAGDVRARLLRRLAKAERLRRPDDAAQAQALLRRASEMQRVHAEQFKQSAATRERLPSAGSSSQALAGASAAAAMNAAATRALGAVVAADASAKGVSSSSSSSSSSHNRSSSRSGPLLLRTAHGAAASGHRSSGVLQPQLPPDKLSRLPNVPLLDVCTGQWRGLWDLFPVKARGCYLGTLSLSASLLRRFFFSFSYPPPFRPRNRAQLLRSGFSAIFLSVCPLFRAP